MPAEVELSALLNSLSVQGRANLAVQLVDGLGDQIWTEDELGALAEERDSELEEGAIRALTYDDFMAGIER
jgi:hypothetical protein